MIRPKKREIKDIDMAKNVAFFLKILAEKELCKETAIEEVEGKAKLRPRTPPTYIRKTEWAEKINSIMETFSLTVNTLAAVMQSGHSAVSLWKRGEVIPRVDFQKKINRLFEIQNAWENKGLYSRIKITNKLLKCTFIDGRSLYSYLHMNVQHHISGINNSKYRISEIINFAERYMLPTNE